MKLKSSSFLFVLALNFGFLMAHHANADVPRPPQFIAFAFDGSYDIGRWDATQDFARALKKQNIDLHFTYFMSSVYFLASENKSQYQGPHHRPGQSDIGFGDDAQDIAERIIKVNEVAADGHEMASHLNGHFDGSDWSASDWNQEFETFYHLLFDAEKINHLPLIDGKQPVFNFRQQDIAGFRSPYLSTSSGLWQALRYQHFLYDTSEVEKMDYWPDKNKGFWKFPLAMLRIAGSGKKTISMDYNFYVSQSAEHEDLENAELYEQQMYETYLQYFMNNYNGSRAPIHIGHHFGMFNGGAYWRALKSFASKVCGLPEVKCVTYKELAQYMEGTTKEQVAAYRSASFEKGKDITFPLTLGKPRDLSLQIQKSSDNKLNLNVTGGDAYLSILQGSQVSWEVNGHVLDATEALDVAQMRSALNLQSFVLSGSVKVGGIEMARTTHVVSPSNQVSPIDLEDLAIMGDLPQAHRFEH